ncbi:MULTISPECIES: hypothetical protein, partial [Rhizobium]|uniref:hypothetical protein n=1 Tax=Rhizobium TaxID=379 RepID=UPI001AEF18EC
HERALLRSIPQAMFPQRSSSWPKSQLRADWANLDTPYPTIIVRRKDLVVIRQPHHDQPLVK